MHACACCVGGQAEAVPPLPYETDRKRTPSETPRGKLLPLGAPVKRTELSAQQLSRGAVDEVRYRR